MLETLSPQEAMTLFPQWRRLFVDVRTEKEFLKRAIPGCPLVPSTNWNVRAGWTAVFPASRSSFFAAREAGRRIRPSSWKEAPRARRISLGGILAWEQAGFPVWSIRELLPCFAQEPAFISGVLA